MCGKGPQAAAVTSLTRYTLRAAAHTTPNPRGAGHAERRPARAVHRHRRPPLLHLRLRHPRTRRRRPHRRPPRLRRPPPALVLRADGHAAYLPTPGGLLVGVVPTAPFTTVRTTLAPGDTLLLYTDGLTEARNGPTRDDLYGEEALLATGVPAHQSATRPATNPS
ncbi:PP2C family protein-serine/threonine phosphatase [Streptomyces sp900105245]|uniref:PP2C family protein-serine/threonine phosphatase n=1 Tax=Streptomyces sp. 900105245 TaxID=3154379 RepID=UPI003325D346